MTVPPLPAVASVRPSGEKATHQTRPTCPASKLRKLARGHLPQAHRSIIAGRGQQTIVRIEGDGLRSSLMATQTQAGKTRNRGPEYQLPIGGAGSQPRIVLGQGQSAEAIVANEPAKIASQPARSRIPDLRGALTACCGQFGPVAQKPTNAIRLGWAAMAGCGRTEGRSQRNNFPSSRPAASILPSGEKTTQATLTAGVNRLRSCPVARSHNLTVPSSLAVARVWPSGEKASQLTSLAWARNLACSWPVAGFHSRTLPSWPQVATSCPFGENATR